MSLTQPVDPRFSQYRKRGSAFLSPLGFNFPVGANGSGKTSALKLSILLGHGRAFRSLGRLSRDSPRTGILFVQYGRLCRVRSGETATPDQRQRKQGSKVRIDDLY